MYKALGLSTLEEQKQHIEKLNSSAGNGSVSVETSQAMQHGTDNEINGIGVLVSKVLPIYEPLSSYFEEGCYRIENENVRNCMIVSPDGSCRVDGVPTVAVEIKCPVPGKTFTTDVHYKIPAYYICQIMSEMHALKCDKLFYICWTPKSFTLLKAYYDHELWNVLTKELERVYGADIGKVSVPKRKSEMVPILKDMIERYRVENVELVAEFPSTVSKSCNHTSTVDSWNDVRAYHKCDVTSEYRDSQRKNIQIQLSSVRQTLMKASKSLKEIYDLLRIPGKEVLVTVLSDLDRKQQVERVHAIPVAYGIAGYSLTCESIRSILAEVVSACEQRGLAVKALSSDGQFYKLAVRDQSDKPLTVLQVAKDTWARVKKLSKQEEISKLMAMNKPLNKDDVNINVPCREHVDGKVLYDGPIAVLGIAGKKWKHLYNPPKLRQLMQTQKRKRNEDTEVETSTLLDCLTPDVINDIENTVEANLDPDDAIYPNCKEDIVDYEEMGETVQDTPEAIDPVSAEVIDSFQVDYSKIVSDIKEHDKERKKAKWNHLNEADIKQLLSSKPDVIMSKFTRKELVTCALHFKSYIELKCDKAVEDMPKVTLANSFSTMLGDKTVITLSQKKSPKSLRNILKEYVTQKFGKEILNAVIATDEFLDVDLPKWREKAVYRDGASIGTSSAPYVWYCQPEYFPTANHHILYLLDCHHLFVNARCFVVQHGISGLNISRQAWVDVATWDRETNVGLNIAMVNDVIDKQSNAMAQLTFSKNVEAEMRKLGWNYEANFCKVIRNWYMAEDEPGLDVMQRHQYRIAMRDMLLGSTNVAEFPTPGSHVAGMPVVMFEGILTNIDRRIQLYSMTPGNSYNVRAPNTLDAENLFSEFRDVDPKSAGALMADDIPIALETASYIMHKKLNPERMYVLNTTKRTKVYPENVTHNAADSQMFMEASPVSLNTNNITMRNHPFDLLERKGRKPRRKSVYVPNPDQPAKGTQPVRQHHKMDSSKILPHVRYGLTDI